ncbi:hypothetical protein K1719_031148 [Acacia pycnantha]|nr:hypothetical protein K1719_031148 [Acacia pycnantha]
MMHPVPFESSPKNEPPPHPGEDQSTKRAKHDEAQVLDDNMKEDPPLSSFDCDTNPDVCMEATISPEMVPETQMSVDPILVQDSLMKSEGVEARIKAPSFKDKLLNSDPNKPNEETGEDITLGQGDVSIGLNGNIPTVNFASHVLDTLNKKMGLAVVVKLLGRRVGYRHLRNQIQNLWKPTGHLKLIDIDDDCFLVKFQEDLDFQNALLNGPWMIFGHYLTVQPWSPSFRPQDHVINQVIGWIRLPKLPARYYHKSIIRSIGSVFGEVIKVDYNTDSGDRGRFARIAVIIDLTKPLISKIQVDGNLIFVEYEGLPSICFTCGRYGHLVDSCPSSMAEATGAQPEHPQANAPSETISDNLTRDSDFGTWMQVQRRRRFNVKGDKINDTNGSKQAVNASRYEVLRMAEEEERPKVYEPVRDNLNPNHETFSRRKKGKESKEGKKSEQGNRQKATVAQNNKQDSIFQSQAYIVRNSPSNLDQNYNQAIQVEDPRLPRHIQPVKDGSASGLGPQERPISGNDPLSKSRGLKLSSGLTVHNLGVKPNPDHPGPSDRSIKDLAREISKAMEEAEDMRPEKGSFVASYKPEIFVLLEPRVSGTKADHVIKRLGFLHSHRVEASGFSGGIWILWSSKVSINVLVNNVQFVHMEVSNSERNSNFLFTAVYGSPQKPNRTFLWHDLSQVSPSPSQFKFLAAWLTHPDFSSIVHRVWSSESDLLTSINSFTSVIRQWNAEVFGSIGKRKRRIFSRLNGIQSQLENHPEEPADSLADLEASLRDELEEKHQLLPYESHHAAKAKLYFSTYGTGWELDHVG